MLRKIKLSRLIFDYNLYPRQKIEPYNVAQMVEALKSGAEFPPIVADKTSLRITDGLHRAKAYQQVLGDVKVTVELKDYKDDAEMFADAIRLNASHGRQLSAYDRAHCIAKAEEFKLQIEFVSSLLNMTPQRLQELKQERSATYKLQPITLKRTAAHLAGQELSAEQAEYNLKAGGMPQTFYIYQVVAMLEADTANWDNPQVVNAMKKLYELLDKAMMVKA